MKVKRKDVFQKAWAEIQWHVVLERSIGGLIAGLSVGLVLYYGLPSLIASAIYQTRQLELRELSRP